MSPFGTVGVEKGMLVAVIVGNVYRRSLEGHGIRRLRVRSVGLFSSVLVLHPSWRIDELASHTANYLTTVYSKGNQAELDSSDVHPGGRADTRLPHDVPLPRSTYFSLAWFGRHSSVTLSSCLAYVEYQSRLD